MGPAPAVAEVRSAVRPFLAALRRSGRGVAPQQGQHAAVLVACSGGADSLALAAAVAFEAARAGLPAGLITVDHALSPGSDERAMRVAEVGRGLGLDPVLVRRVDVGRAGGPEAAARTARYAALDAAAAEHGARIALGHTLNDQAETVLLGFGRGSGPRSVAGMAPLDGCYLRPLLGVRRSVTRAACAALGLEPWDDPHNTDPSFQRVRLRTEVLPLLEDVLQGGVAPALARTAGLLRDDLAALDDWAAAAAAAAATAAAAGDARSLDVAPSARAAALDVAALAALPRAVRTRVLRNWAHAAGAGPLTAERTAALDALVVAWHGQGPVQLPGRVAVRRASGTLVLESAAADRAAPPPARSQE